MSEEFPGVFPDGQLNDDDEGSISTAVGMDNGRVMILWPKPITWIAFNPDAAEEFADLVKATAQKARAAAQRNE